MIRNAVLNRTLIVLTLHLFLRSQATAGEVEWERAVKAAEQEGQVVVYKIARDSEWQAFQKKFPKIKVVLIQGNAAQIQQRLLAERRAGKFLADVVRLGGGTSTSLYKAKALDPIGPALILSEVKDVSKWLDGKHHYNDIDNQYVFVRGLSRFLLGYNQKFVDPKTLTSYWDLLDPKWKGKITIKDPKEPGGGSPCSFCITTAARPGISKKLFSVAGLTLVRDDRQQTDWLAAGKFPITLTSKPPRLKRRRVKDCRWMSSTPMHLSRTASVSKRRHDLAWRTERLIPMPPRC
jgi:hypothetical protein